MRILAKRSNVFNRVLLSGVVFFGFLAFGLFVFPNKASAQFSNACGDTTNNAHNYATLLVSVYGVRHDSGGAQEEVKESDPSNAIWMYIKTTDNTNVNNGTGNRTRTSGGNLYNTSNKQRLNNAAIYAKTTPCFGMYGFAINRHVTNTFIADNLTNHVGNWALDCDVSKGPGIQLQRFNIEAYGVPKGFRPGGTWALGVYFGKDTNGKDVFLNSSWIAPGNGTLTQARLVYYEPAPPPPPKYYELSSTVESTPVTYDGSRTISFKVKNNKNGDSIKSDNKGVTIKVLVKVGSNTHTYKEYTDQKIPGNGNWLPDGTILSVDVDDPPIGEEVCASIFVTPVAGQTNGPVSNYGDPQPFNKQLNKSCTSKGVCNPDNDPDNLCPQPQCDPNNDPDNICPEPCDPNNDPDNLCPQPQCDPNNDPDNICPEPCDPDNDPDNICPGICDPDNPDSNCPSVCDPGDPDCAYACDPAITSSDCCDVNYQSCGTGDICDPASDPTCIQDPGPDTTDDCNTDGSCCVPLLPAGFNCQHYSVKGEPYFRVYGSDIVVGKQFMNNGVCSSKSGSSVIDSFALQTGTDFIGAGSQFAVTSTNQMRGLLSANMHGGITSTADSNGKVTVPNIDLMFTNNVITKLGYDTTAYTGCMPDYKQMISSDAGGSFTPLGTSVTHLTQSMVDSSSSKRFYKNGDLIINENLTTTIPSSYTDLDDFKPLIVIVKGNIKIAPNVTSLDGLYVAMPDTGNTKGAITTCARAAQINALPSLQSCQAQLTVNGSFVAKKVYLNRLRGSISHASPNEPASSNNIAEKFIFTPDMYFGLMRNLTPNLSNTSNSPYDSIVSLPPSL